MGLADRCDIGFDMHCSCVFCGIGFGNRFHANEFYRRHYPKRYCMRGGGRFVHLSVYSGPDCTAQLHVCCPKVSLQLNNSHKEIQTLFSKQGLFVLPYKIKRYQYDII